MKFGRRAVEFFAALFSKRKRFLEYGLPIVLLSAGLITYLLVSGVKEREASSISNLRDRTFSNAMYHYRLENFERAELLFNRVVERSGSRKKKSTALLFLGNIYYQREAYDRALEYYEDAILHDRKNYNALHNASVALVKLHREEDALRYAKQLYSMNKELPENILLLGNILFSKGRYREAAALYEEGTEGSAGNSDLFSDVFAYNLTVTQLHLADPAISTNSFAQIMGEEKSTGLIKGLSAYQLGILYENTNMEASQEAFEKALHFFPHSDRLAFDLALIQLKNARYENAIALLGGVEEEVIEEHRSMVLGYALFKSGRTKEALELFTAIDTVSPRQDLDYIIGDLYVKAGMPDQAKEYYKRAIEEPGFEGAFINLVRILQEAGAYRDAVEFCEQYAEREPENPLPGILLGDINFKLGNPGEARKWLERAYHLSEQEGQDLLKVAAVWMEHGYHNNALLIYYEILDSDPQNEKVLVRIAEVYRQTGHNKRASTLLERAREKAADLTQYYRLSLLLAVCADTEHAKAIYRELIEDFPYKYEAYYNLSLLLVETGEYEESSHVVKSCLEYGSDLDPQVLGSLHTILGYLHVMLGRREEAQRAFAEAVRLDPESEIPHLNLRTLGLDER
jgi:tetratricopeptide (TPR) repeat protein